MTTEHRKTNTVRTRILARSILVLSLLAGFGCGVGEGPAGDDPLRQVDIPADFTFRTTRSVTVRVDAGLTVIPTGAKLIVERASGAVVFEGALQPDQPLTLELMTPVSDERLTLRLVAEHQVFEAHVVADGAELAYTFTEEDR